MNNLVLFSLIVLMCLRAIGLAVSIDFYKDSRDQKFLFFILSWSFWIIANSTPITIELIDLNWVKELHHVLNVTCDLLGCIFYIWGFYQYFMRVPFKLMSLIIIISIVFPFLMYIFMGYSMAITISSISIYFVLITAYILPSFKIVRFKEYMGKSAKWYYIILFILFLYFPISAITFLSGYKHGLYTTDDPFLIMMYYVPAIIITGLLNLLLVHLEFTISSREKFELKDKYSHDLGNIMQVLYSSLDLIELRKKINTEGQNELRLIRQKCEEASELINNIRKL
ncbi:MAG: hypothetical protein ACFFHD_10400 [Promethearchaeota archaeon]